MGRFLYLDCKAEAKSAARQSKFKVLAVALENNCDLMFTTKTKTRLYVYQTMTFTKHNSTTDINMHGVLAPVYTMAVPFRAVRLSCAFISRSSKDKKYLGQRQQCEANANFTTRKCRLPHRREVYIELKAAKTKIIL